MCNYPRLSRVLFTQALTNIAECVFACDDPIQSGVPSSQEEIHAKDVRGLQILRAGYPILIHGSPNKDQFWLEFSYTITEQIDLRDQSTADTGDIFVKMAEEGELDAAQDEFANSKIRNSRLGPDPVWEDINGESLFNGFRLSTTIYPLSDRFGPREYDQAVSSVRKEGMELARTINSELTYFSVDPEEVAVDEVPSGSRGFM